MLGPMAWVGGRRPAERLRRAEWGFLGNVPGKPCLPKCRKSSRIVVLLEGIELSTSPLPRDHTTANAL